MGMQSAQSRQGVDRSTPDPPLFPLKIYTQP